MIHKHGSGTNQISKSAYVSCIKVGGVPILPPLITDEERLQLQEYKKKAVDIERRLKCQRDLKLFIEQLPDTLVNKEDNSKRTLENILTFTSDNSHADALNVTDISNCECKLPSEDNETAHCIPNENVVPLLKHNLKPKLSCNIFDVTQYDDNGVIIFNEYARSDHVDEVNDSLSASVVELDLTTASQNACNNNEKIEVETPVTNVDKSPSTSSPRPLPRLLRSNSYTLESPSPILLEHFKKQAEIESGAAVVFEKYLGQRRRSLNSVQSVDSSYRPNTAPASFTKISTNTSNEHIHDDISNGCDIPVEVVENLARLHFGTNEKQLPEESAQDLHCKIAEAEAALKEVLGDMPRDHAKDIMDLLERHRMEQELKLESYTKFKQKLLDGSDNLNGITLPMHGNIETNQTQCDEESKICLDDSKSYIDESQSCTIQYSPSSAAATSNVFNTSQSLLIEFESDSEPALYFDCKSSHCVDEQDILMSPNGYQRCSTSFRESITCNRELFIERPDKLQRQLREQWAGTILTAAVKGYLVRRLMRTDRVKSLVQTIRDAVVCAVGLHSEDTDSIQPSDVELHRRLIQQISAACYEFYDIFFGLSTREQMTMIAVDRQKLQDKMKRSSSSSSLKLDSNRSATKVQKQTFATRQRKTLTPSFAA